MRTPNFLFQAEDIEEVTPDSAENSKMGSLESSLEEMSLSGASKWHNPVSCISIV